MQFKRNLVAAGMLALAVSVSAHAEDDAWGDVSGNTDSGGWGAPVVEEALPVVPAGPGKLACGTDDPRYASLPQVLRELQGGATIEPLQLSFPTYVSLNQNVRKVLGDNFYISSPDCSEQHLFNGEFTGKVSVNFTDLWQIINDAVRTDDQGLLNFVAKNSRVEPESALNVISMVQYVSLNDSEIRKLYTAIAPDKAKGTDVEKPLMLEVYLAFGGTVVRSERDTTVFIWDSYKTVIGLFLAGKGGEAHPSGLDKKETDSIVSMLQTIGLRPQLAGNNAKRLASE